MKEKINWEEFSKEAAELIRKGKPLTGDKGIFTPLIKQVVEAALEGEMDVHIQETRESEDNRRNGRTPKNLKSPLGSFEIFTPRDRTGSFEPQTIEKRQTILPGDIEDKILGLYGLGMSYKDIQGHLNDMYGLSVSDGVINSITDPGNTYYQAMARTSIGKAIRHSLDGCHTFQGSGRWQGDHQSCLFCSWSKRAWTERSTGLIFRI
jgi:transposase-like protein